MNSKKSKTKYSIKRSGSAEFTPFWHTLTHALETVREPKKMGEESPLAAPYLLGNKLPTNHASADKRGRVLGRILQEAASELDGKNGRRYQKILDEYYFQGKSVRVVCDTVGLGKTTFHDNRKRAISQLESVLIETLRPAIRLETPSSVPENLIGRSKELEMCQRALTSGESLSITGPSGVGKTALGQILYHQWGSSNRFWFTISPGINDHQSSILFALGYFLSNRGQPSLWQEIVAGDGTIPTDRALQMLRYAIDELKDRGQRLIFCIDAVERLQADNPQHEQIRTLLDRLCQMTNVVLIGQRVPLATAAFCPLVELSQSEVGDYLSAEGIQLTAKQEARLQYAVKGNCRLLMLFASLYKQRNEQKRQDDYEWTDGRGTEPINGSESGLSNNLDRLLDKISATPTVEFMLSQILENLGQDERSLLMSLSVFRDAAPADVWHSSEKRAVLEMLLWVRLIESDNCGGVRIVPIYRRVIENNIPDEKKQTLHAHAASIYAARCQYTSAVYHYIRAEQQEHAIWLWRDNQQSEINQGRGNEARRIFDQVSPQKLTKESAECLALIQADLSYLMGNFTQALETIRSIFWETPILSIEAGVAGGKFAAELSEFEKAQQHYQAALDDATILLHGQLAKIHKGLGWIHMRNRALSVAWREASLSRFEAENLQGILLEMQYEREQAVAHYQSALNVAQDIGYQSGIARVNVNLSMLHTMLGTFEEAEQYLDQALDAFEQLGEQASVAGIMINRALICNLSGKHHQAIEHLNATQSHLKKTRLPISPWQDALIAQGFAEAYLGLAQLDEAEQWARHAIALEEGDVLADSYRTLGEIMLARGNHDDARRHINFSIELCQQMGEPDLYLLGYAWRSLTHVEIQAGEKEVAAAARERAIEIFQAIQLVHEVEQIPQI